MRPMLDDLELPQVQEITGLDRRTLVEHKPPGMEGSVLQNLGRRPGRVELWGVATGPDAAAFIDKLTTKFRAGTPVPFTADIVADAKIDRVMIADLHAEEEAGKPQRYAYRVTLQEFIEPTAPATASAAASPELLADIAADAQGLVDGLADALDLAPAFATGLEPFVGKMEGLLQRLQQFRTAVSQANG